MEKRNSIQHQHSGKVRLPCLQTVGKNKNKIKTAWGPIPLQITILTQCFMFTLVNLAGSSNTSTNLPHLTRTSLSRTLHFVSTATTVWTSLFDANLDCRVFWIQRRHHRICKRPVYDRLPSVHIIAFRNPPEGLEKCHQSLHWVTNRWSSIFGWTVPLTSVSPWDWQTSTSHL